MEWIKHLNGGEAKGIAHKSPSKFASLASKAVLQGLLIHQNSQLKKQGLAPLDINASKAIKETASYKKMEKEVANLIYKMDKSTGGNGENAVLFIEKEFKLLKQRITQGKL